MNDDGTDGAGRPTTGSGQTGPTAGAGPAGPRAKPADAPRSRPTPMPGDLRPGQRLEHAPGERYAPRTSAGSGRGAAVAVHGSAARAVAFAVPVAIVAAAISFAFSGLLAVDSGLVIVAILSGLAIGRATKVGAGGTIPRNRSAVIAICVTVGWFLAAQIATWIYARSEGGDLPILDYLLQAFGPIVPLMWVAAVLAAWWSAR